MEGLINIQKKDNEHFRWYLVRYLNRVNKNLARIRYTDKNFSKQLNFKGVKFPIHKKDHAKIEKQNRIICPLMFLVMKMKHHTVSIF